MADAEPGTTNTNGYQEGSASIVVHLVKGDIVSLSGCTAASSIHWPSLFLGILLQAD